MFFKKDKNIQFIPAICPKCGGRLELDSSFEVAYCKDCGSHVFIKNAKRSEKGAFDKVVSVIERQQELVRQDMQEEIRKQQENEIRLESLKKEKELRRNNWWSDNWWKLGIFILILFVLSIISGYLGIV